MKICCKFWMKWISNIVVKRIRIIWI